MTNMHGERGYKNALQYEEFEIDCAATLHLRIPLLYHSPRARCLCLQGVIYPKTNERVDQSTSDCQSAPPKDYCK